MKKIIIFTLLAFAIHLNAMRQLPITDTRSYEIIKRNLEYDRRWAQDELDRAQKEVANIEGVNYNKSLLPAAKDQLEKAKKEVERIDEKLQKAKEEYEALSADKK